MMTTREAYAIDHDHHSDAESYLVEAIREYAQKCEDLRSRVAEVRRVCDHVDEYLEHDHQLNSLGELQSRAADFDRLCTERHNAGQAVTKLAWQLVRLGALTEARMDAILTGTPFERKDVQR